MCEYFSPFALTEVGHSVANKAVVEMSMKYAGLTYREIFKTKAVQNTWTYADETDILKPGIGCRISHVTFDSSETVICVIDSSLYITQGHSAEIVKAWTSPQKLVEWLILTTGQLVTGYFVSWGYRSAFIVCSYNQFLWSSYLGVF